MYLSTIHGLLNINKPSGMTSRSVVDRALRVFRGMRAGHAGTLDPLASGVLIVCLGGATRLVDYVHRMRKTYRTTVRLGARSDTFDAEGQIEESITPVMPSEASIREALAAQVGTISQAPPPFSALRVAGRRAYDLARQGQRPKLAARSITVHRVELLSYAWPALSLEIECGSGTYIRSIAHDLGEVLGCGGLVEVLVRTQIGPFTLADAIDLARLDDPSPERLIRPASEAVAELPHWRLSFEQCARTVQGQSIPLSPLEAAALPDGEIALLAPDGLLVAIGQHDKSTGQLLPRRVLQTYREE
jgi:tRNA pseudouridine55 synthase